MESQQVQAQLLSQPSGQPSSHPPVSMDTPSMTNNSEAVLLQLLRQQVEFYFSEENLAQDSYLLSFLNSNDHPGVVPAATIASFPKVREIYASHMAGHFVPAKFSFPADPTLVGKALTNSTVVQVTSDGYWMMPMRNNFIANKSAITSPTVSPTSFDTPCEERVLIFGMPDDIHEQEILEAFTAPHVMPLLARLYKNNTWYVVWKMNSTVFFLIYEP
jgi:hypothetical protein